MSVDETLAVQACKRSALLQRIRNSKTRWLMRKVSYLRLSLFLLVALCGILVNVQATMSASSRAISTVCSSVIQGKQASLSPSALLLYRETDADGGDGLEDGVAVPQSADVAAAEWSAFWGWDCCGPNGILDNVYAALEVPQKAWPGLKRLPEAGGVSLQSKQHYLELVSSYIQ